MLTVRKHANLLNTKSLAYASSGCSRGIGLSKYKSNCSVNYEIEGSYTQRCCSVYDNKRRRVAEIKRKESVGGVSFGMDVFRLIVHSEIESAVAMALVIVLDQMFGSSKRFSIWLQDREKRIHWRWRRMRILNDSSEACNDKQNCCKTITIHAHKQSTNN